MAGLFVRKTEFLARVDDPAMHGRFWAEDLVYVSAVDVVKTKAEILDSMRAGDASGARDRKPEEPKATFTAEEVKVRPLTPDVAVLNVRRYGSWRAISWQATREER